MLVMELCVLGYLVYPGTACWAVFIISYYPLLAAMLDGHRRRGSVFLHIKIDSYNK